MTKSLAQVYLFLLKTLFIFCRTLKYNTAYGCDKIYVENLKCGGPALMYLISRLFTSMHYHTYRPKQLKKGVIVPIPKSEKDPSEPTNNRGITLMSVISKVRDSIVFKRHEKWFKRVLNVKLLYFACMLSKVEVNKHIHTYKNLKKNWKKFEIMICGIHYLITKLKTQT